MIATAAVAGLALATPALAQTTFSAPVPAKRLWPSFAPELTTKTAPKQTRNEQGLGIFVQGGWVRQTQYGADGLPENIDAALQGWIVGIAFGGNKSGWFGVGVDINYMVIGDDDTGIFQDGGDLSLHYIDIPVYGRINFFGHKTKNAATLYAIVGGFVDILLQGDLGDLDVKDSFNGFDAGIVGGLGFEVARIGIEWRVNWALTTLASDDGGLTFNNGLEDSRKFTMMILFRFRLH
jgi:hypothetical protein